MSTAKKRGNYTEECLQRALSAIKDGMPTLRASEIFNIPRSTLRNKIAGRVPETKCKPGPECVLGKEVEDEVVVWLKECADMGFPVSKEGLLFSIKNIVKEQKKEFSFKNGTPGRKWFENFLTRHPDMSYKRSEYLNKALASITEEKIRQWFADTLNLLGTDAHVLEDPSRVWNMDETAFFLNPTGGLVIAEKGKPVYGTSSNSDKENVTTLITVNASGQFAPPLTLYKFDRIPAHYYSCAPKEWGIGKSKNGWKTAETFLQYFENVFHPFLIKNQVELPIIVFLDGHSSHLSLGLSRFCRRNGIIIICLYPNTTHILQPLDVSVFFPLKARWKKEVSLWKIQNDGNEIKKKDVPKILNKVLTENNFKETIENGFRTCGLFPYDANNVNYNKCTKKNVPPIQQEETATATSEKIAEHLIYFEGFIEPNLLKSFQQYRQLGGTPIDEKALYLFNVWSNIRLELESAKKPQAEPANVKDPFQDDVLEFPFPEFSDFINEENNNVFGLMENEDAENIEKDVPEETREIDHSLGNSLKIEQIKEETRNTTSNEKPELKSEECDIEETITAMNSNSNFCDNTVIEGASTASLSTNELRLEFENGISSDRGPFNIPICDTNALNDQKKEKNSTVRNSETISNTPSCDNKKPNINILSDILVLPNTSSVGKKKNREHLISVLTSDKWLEREEAKQREKNEKERLKNERKRKREEKRQEKQASLITKRAKKKQNKEFEKENDREENVNPKQQNKTSESIDLQMKEEKQEKLVSLIKKPATKKQNAEFEEESEEEEDNLEEGESIDLEMENSVKSSITRESILEHLDKGVFVVVKYEGKYYSGIIVRKEKNMYLVSAMCRSGSDWRWPDKEDEIFYDRNAIEEIITKPVRKNNRGVYYVPEMSKYSK